MRSNSSHLNTYARALWTMIALIDDCQAYVLHYPLHACEPSYTSTSILCNTILFSIDSHWFALLTRKSSLFGTQFTLENILLGILTKSNQSSAKAMATKILG